MRGSTKGLTLRKGVVEKKLAPRLYQIIDSLTGEIIITSLSTNLNQNNFKLETGDIAYVIVSKYDLTRGRLAVKGHRGGLEEFIKDKEILDNHKDPLKEN